MLYIVGNTNDTFHYISVITSFWGCFYPLNTFLGFFFQSLPFNYFKWSHFT